MTAIERLLGEYGRMQIRAATLAAYLEFGKPMSPSAMHDRFGRTTIAGIREVLFELNRDIWGVHEEIGRLSWMTGDEIDAEAMGMSLTELARVKAMHTA